MSRIICFLGSKGGSGKTLLALNTAMCLTREVKKKVFYLDANFPVSNQSSEIIDELTYSEFLDSSFAAETIKFTAQVVSDVHFQACFSGKSVDFATKETVAKKIASSLVKESIKYDFVFIDIGSAILPQHKVFLDVCTDIVIVVEDDASGITRLANDVEYLKLQNYSSTLFRIAINKWQSDSAITEDWLAARFGVSSYGFIPYLEDKSSVNPFLNDSKKNKKNAAVFDAFLKFSANLQNTKVEHKNIHSLVKSISDQVVDEQKEKQRKKIRSLKIILQEEILKLIDLKHLEIGSKLNEQDMRKLEEKVEAHAIRILDSKTDIVDRHERNDIIASVIDGVLYLGPLMPLLRDEDISEIMVNDANTIYIEKKGKLILSDAEFLSEKQQLRIIDRIVAPIGRRIDVSSPMVDARLLDGSRVNIIIPPLAPKGSIITIRKFEKDPLGIRDLVGFGTINQQMVTFLEAVVRSRMNIVVSGGTGSGKTTLLNILSSYIPDDERVITVEDSAELQLKQAHVLTLEARPPNIEDKGEVTIRDLVRNALRMRPERIVVGECRAGEALDMLQAMNTGHDGSMTTIHANSSNEMLSRIETLVMYAGTQLPSIAIRQQIHSAVDIIFQIARLKDGTRKVIQISEVTGLEGDQIKTEDIFVYKQTGVDIEGKYLGNFIATGYVPNCMDRFEANGIEVPREIFWSS